MQYLNTILFSFLVGGSAFVSAAPTGKSYSLNLNLLGLTLATENCASVPSSDQPTFEQYIAGLDCQRVGNTASQATYNCELTSNLTGDLGGILDGIASACGSAGGTAEGGHLLRK